MPLKKSTSPKAFKANVAAEAPVPNVTEFPPVWVSPRASRRLELLQLLKDLGATIETGAKSF
mgnify:CR=1 FL=1